MGSLHSCEKSKIHTIYDLFIILFLPEWYAISTVFLLFFLKKAFSGDPKKIHFFSFPKTQLLKPET